MAKAKETQSVDTEINSQPELSQDQGGADTTQGAELNISDLNTIRAIIDLASARGAFKTSEMVSVGTTYDKLASFLDKVAAQQQAQQEAQQEAQ